MNIMIPEVNIYAVIPQLILVAIGTLVLILGLFDFFRRCLPYLNITLLVACGLFLTTFLGQRAIGFSSITPMMVMDDFSLICTLIFIGGCILTILISISYNEIMTINRGEYYALLTFAVAGMSMMAASTDLFSFFLGLEVLSISLYVLIGFDQDNNSSNEAAVKYFLLGAFASGFIIYGIALIYGATGSTDYDAIVKAGVLGSTGTVDTLLLGGVALLLVGLGFKISMVPFHSWTPDVYQGAPTPVAAFLSTGSKAAVFVVLIRLLSSVFSDLQMEVSAVITVLAVLTIGFGNIVALVQTNLKRLLAYSSISHAGYMLLPFISNSQDGNASIIFYLIVYTAMNIAAFGVLALMSTRSTTSDTLDDLTGLGRRAPLYAAIMTIVLLSLAGLPPTAGFMAKFYLFSNVISEGNIGLAVFGLLFSGISLYYYLRVVIWMYMRQDPKEKTPGYQPASISGLTALCISTLAILAGGIFPSELIEIAQQAVMALQ